MSGKKKDKWEEKIRAYAIKNAVEHEGKARVESVLSALFHEGLGKEEIKKFVSDVRKIVNEINSLSREQQKKEFLKLEKYVGKRKERVGLPELPNVKKGAIMRFRPAPSGPLHVGHVVSSLVSSLYVKKYGGKFYVIIDDTDPKTVSKEAYSYLKKDCDWIFGNVTEYINASDRISLYYKYIESLINKDKAYVCICSQDKFKIFSQEKKECPCRKNSVKENTGKWKRMLDKTGKGFKEGEAVVRFKSGMKNRNPALRDFPLARIDKKEHPIQKRKYKVWPLMNLGVSVDDMELKMTHIIRGKDHRDNAKRQEMIFSVFNKKYPWNAFIGRVKFTDIILSKRKIKAAIESGEFKGYDDERLPTIASLRKRGYKKEAFDKFVEQRGLSEVDKVISQKDFFQILDQFNR